MRNIIMILVALGLGTKRHWHIFLAIIAGAVAGFYLPLDPANPSVGHEVLSVVGQLFIRMIAMLAVPLIMSSLLIGMSSLGDGRHVGKMGVRMITLFIGFMLISGVMAATITYFAQPGSNVSLDIAHLDIRGLTEEHPEVVSSAEDRTLTGLIMNLVPKNPFQALAQGNLVPIIVFTLLFGAATSFIGETARPLVAFFEAVFAVTMKIVDWVMLFSVPGVFALTFVAAAQGGLYTFTGMMPYVACIITGLLLLTLVVFPVFLWVMARVNFMDLYGAISEALLVAFGTASSSATLPVSLACMERRAGVSNRIASFVLPTGATMNMNGTTIFEVTSVMFLAQLYGIPLNLETIITIIFLAIVASIGAAGVPSAGLITMAVILNGIGRFEPQQVAVGLSLLWAVDRILDMARTVVNVIDDCVVATIIAADEGELNRDMLASGEGWEEIV
ncbi:MAG: dicarboxylate/amino acid:cation symporter [Cyanobacteria bacterium HKST-UBA04]|nr:dicarboxylate/amino acid:cation symporter [Cyanobacteria bacterium HKST-UBA04]MCA9840573.1 dicarboxylate/amino acid:cation symporter [Cyanobacteria bacterium HKST-UBA03]